MKNTYILPPNFAEEGEVSGIKIRNIIEAIVVGGILLTFWIAMPFPLKFKLYAGIITIIPTVAIALIGINGFSVTQFFGIYRGFKKNAKVIKAPTSKDKIEREKMLMEKKIARDKLIEKEQKQLEKEQRKNAVRKSRRKVDEE